MNKGLIKLTQEVERARAAVIGAVENLSQEQSSFKPSENEWSVVEILEHLVKAEEGGIFGMFKAIHGIKTGSPIWEGTSPNQGLSIEEVIANTWKPKEIVPEVAAPKWGAPLDYWLRRFKNCRLLLDELVAYCGDTDPEQALFPHPISGPLNILQRFEFLRFHMERHLGQIERVIMSYEL